MRYSILTLVTFVLLCTAVPKNITLVDAAPAAEAAQNEAETDTPAKIFADALSAVKAIDSEDAAKSAEPKMKEIGARWTNFRQTMFAEELDDDAALARIKRLYEEGRESHNAMRMEYTRIKETSPSAADLVFSAMALRPRDVELPLADYDDENYRRGFFIYRHERIESKNTANLKQIDSACRLYANSNDGKFPADLGVCLKDDLPLQHLKSPRSKSRLPQKLEGLTLNEKSEWLKANPDYLYFGQGKDHSIPADDLLACENPDQVTGRLYVLLGNGQIKTLPREEVIERIKK